MKAQNKQHPSGVATALVAVSLISISSLAHAQRAEDIFFTPEKIKTIPGHGMTKAEYPYDEGGKYRKEWVNTWAKSPVSTSTTVRQPIPKTSVEHSNFTANERIKQGISLKQQLKHQKMLADQQLKAPRRGTQVVATPPETTPVVYNNFSEPSPILLPQPRLDTPTPKSDLIAGGYIGPYGKMNNSIPEEPVAQKSTNRSALSSITNIFRRPKAPEPKPIVAIKRPEPAKTYIPSPPPATAPIASRTQLPKPAPVAVAPTSYHQVIKGDTLYSISRRYKVSIDSLKRSNGLTSDLIRIGQSLRVEPSQSPSLRG